MIWFVPVQNDKLHEWLLRLEKQTSEFSKNSEVF